MDADFFKELEESISNAGTDEVWERTIGGRRILLSPISFVGQGKVQEALSNKDFGSNIIGESKRITLSHAIVGMDKFDLSKHRIAGPVFGPVQMPGGKSLKVDLPTYIYLKMANWGSQFVDDIFNVFADLMETHAKENVKEVKFENAKNPVDELGDLMVRVTELRVQLGMSPLVEGKSVEENEVEDFNEEQAERARESEEAAERQKKESSAESFDPFRTMQVDDMPPRGSNPRQPVIPPPPVRSPITSPPPPEAVDAYVPRTPDPVPVTTVPVVIPQNMRRTHQVAEAEGHTPVSTPQSPFVASPSISHEVIEAPAARSQASPPVIDPKAFGRNPRFNPPKG